MLKYDDNLAQAIIKKAKKENLLIINAFGGVSLDNFKEKVINVTPGPADFIALISKAEYVFAVSFHGIAFSILFNKNFYYSLNNKQDSSDFRTKNLLLNFDLPSREICGGKMPDNSIDWERVNQNLNNKRNYSIFSLLDSLNITIIKKIDEPKLIAHKPDNISTIGVRCVGCENCINICPTKAISSFYDEEGFLYPKVDENRCISCGKCLSTCPVNTSKSTKHNENCLAASLKDNEELYKSASGGVAQALYHYYLSIGGIGYGVKYNDDYCSTEYIRVDSEKTLQSVLKSKYLPAKVGNIFNSVKKDLENDLQVLFIGTPCIIIALKLFLKIDYKKLICVELICHGPTSPKVVKKYFDEQKVNKHKGISYFTMRQKVNNNSLNINLKLNDGKQIIEPFNETNSLGAGYICVSRPSCYACQAKGDYRQGDITIGDYWGCTSEQKGFNKNGTSLVFLHTEKGKEVFSKISNSLNIYKANYEMALKHNRVIVDSITPFFGRISFIDRSFIKNQKMSYAIKKTERKTTKIKKLVPVSLKKIIKKIIKK